MRGLRRSPGFSAVAILTLALGVGVNTAIFSVINAVVLRPLPYRDPATLVLVDTSPLSLAPAWLTAAWRDRARTLSDFAGFNGPRAATLVHLGVSQQIDAADVTWNFLSLLGVTPSVGRDFVASDADGGAPAVAILSHELWQRAFGSDQTILGSTMTITGNAVTIVGVAPAGFRFPTGGALPATRMPTDTQPDVLRVVNADAPVNVIGRLAPGAVPSSATSELLAIFKQEAVTRFRGDAVDRLKLDAAPLQDRLIGNVRQRLWLVMGAVSFVLLVACTNVASLLLARASSRQRELALRMALGAGRSRVARLVLTESLLLALLGVGRCPPVCLHDRRRGSHAACRSDSARRFHHDRRARAGVQRRRRGSDRDVVRARFAARRQASQRGPPSSPAARPPSLAATAFVACCCRRKRPSRLSSSSERRCSSRPSGISALKTEALMRIDC